MTFGADEVPLPTSNVVGFIRGAINEDVGATQALGAFREAGGAIRTQRWFDLYRSESAVASQYPEMLGLDPNATPQFGAYEPFEMGSREGYAARVRVTVWDVEAQQFVDKWFTHWSAEPFTPADAEQAAIDEWSGIPTGDTGNVYAIGATVARVGVSIPYRRGG